VPDQNPVCCDFCYNPGLPLYEGGIDPLVHICGFCAAQAVAQTAPQPTQRRLALGVSNHFKGVADTWGAADPIVSGWKHPMQPRLTCLMMGEGLIECRCHHVVARLTTDGESSNELPLLR
jgi:hypothetical protein